MTKTRCDWDVFQYHTRQQTYVDEQICPLKLPHGYNICFSKMADCPNLIWLIQWKIIKFNQLQLLKLTVAVFALQFSNGFCQKVWKIKRTRDSGNPKGPHAIEMHIELYPPNLLHIVQSKRFMGVKDPFYRVHFHPFDLCLFQLNIFKINLKYE